jgi:hypothetical protein
MTVKELIEKTGWKLSTPSLDTEIPVDGAYCGDLLSWVMGNGEPQQAWITVQVHANVIAVALLREFSCLIVADGANVTPEFADKAAAEELVVIESNLPVYESAKKLVELGL